MSFRKPFRAVPIKLGHYYREQRRAKIMRDVATVTLTFVGAIVAGLLLTGLMQFSATASAAADGTVSACRVVDGDTLRCDGERIRLLGIDAPETPGHCAIGRDCAPGDPFASTRSLKDAIGDSSELQISRVGTDRYGRTLAVVAGKQGDLSCWQLRHAQATYKPKWDNESRVARLCPDVAQ